MLLWFRNDLRIDDNPALHYALENHVTRAIYFITPKQWKLHNMAPMKVDFILRHVEVLQKNLQTLGISLDIIEVDDFKQQSDYLLEYCNKLSISKVIANKELELNEVVRDKGIMSQGIELHLFEADVIVPKGVLLNKSGSMYKVFTPFSKAWLEYVRQNGFSYRGKPPVRYEDVDTAPKLSVKAYTKPKLSESISHNLVDSSAWPLAEDFIKDHIPTFLQTKIEKYNDQRDIPGVKGTSGLSPYLAIGAISPNYLLYILLNQYPDLLLKHPEQPFVWLNELIWREFYRHLIHHFPDLCKHHCFNAKYQTMPWPNKQSAFEAWCEGKTGYPIVDAAMRQLLATGWMHNRLRMIVASFLTKHLLIDWRWGEKFFMEHLIDGDFAANNGGWQWSAGTGCDAQPYFRVFNPIRQSERFDPNGDFVRKYLPELTDVPNKHIHFPHQYLSDNDCNTYWPPIVDHKTARLRALDFYKTSIN